MARRASPEPLTAPPGPPARRVESAIGAAERRLLGAQRRPGRWRDFRTLAGASDQWVSAYVGLALAASPDREAQRTSRRAWGWLRRRQPWRRGWSYGAAVPPDADSTAWAVRLALALGGDPGSWRLRRALAFLGEHQRDGGGIATYADSGPIRLFTRLTGDASFDGWCGAHVCVSAAVAAIPRLPGRERTLTFLRRAQSPDGSWPAYWWEDRGFSTALAVETLSGAPGDHRIPVRRARAWAAGRLEREDEPPPFVLACLLRVLGPRAGRSDAGLGALDRLLRRQDDDGGWPGSARLRIPPPHVVRPDDYGRWVEDGRGGGSVQVDAGGLFTTATALTALRILSGEGREAASPGRRPGGVASAASGAGASAPVRPALVRSDPVRSGPVRSARVRSAPAMFDAESGGAAAGAVLRRELRDAGLLLDAIGYRTAMARVTDAGEAQRERWAVHLGAPAWATVRGSLPRPISGPDLSRILGFGARFTEELVRPARASGSPARDEVVALGALSNLIVTVYDALMDGAPGRPPALTGQDLQRLGGGLPSPQPDAPAEALMQRLVAAWFGVLDALPHARRRAGVRRLVTRVVEAMYEAESATHAVDAPAPSDRLLRRKAALPFVTMALPVWLATDRLDVGAVRAQLRRAYRVGELVGWVDDAIDLEADRTSGHPNRVDRGLARAAAAGHDPAAWWSDVARRIATRGARSPVSGEPRTAGGADDDVLAAAITSWYGGAGSDRFGRDPES